MSRNVFILGAGASREAGGPLMTDFLDIAEALWKGEEVTPKDASFALVFKAIGALQAVHSKSTLDLDNLESVFGAFELARLFGRLGNLADVELRELGSAIRQVIVQTIEKRIIYPVHERQARPPIPYERFVALIRAIGTQHTSVITFNYDVALDYAFHWSNTAIDYCLPSTISQKGLGFMKLHGSLNWGRCDECSSIIPWPMHEFFSNRNWDLSFRETNSVSLDIASHLSALIHCGKPVSTEPVIVPPTWNKTQYYEDLATVWRTAAHHLTDAEHIFIIGYSLPEADQFFRYLYALGTVGDTRLKRIWVFDPDSSGQVCMRFEKLLGPMARSRFELKQKTFSEAITDLQKEDGIGVTGMAKLSGL